MATVTWPRPEVRYVAPPWPTIEPPEPPVTDQDMLFRVTFRASGTDDGGLLGAAIDAADAGTVFYFPDPVYIIDTEVVVSKDNIYMVGRGGSSNPVSTNATLFQRQSGSGRMITWDKSPGLGAQGSPSSQYLVNGGGMERIVIDGNLLASTGLRIVTARNLTFTETTVRGAATCIQIANHGTTNGADSWDHTTGCEWNHLEVIATDGVGILLDAWAYSLSFHDVSVVVTSASGVGIDLLQVDDIWFHGTRVLTQDAAAIGIRATGADYIANGGTGKPPTGVHFFGGYPNGSGTDLQVLGDGFDMMPILQFHGRGTEDGDWVTDLDAGALVTYLDMEGRHNLRLDGRTTFRIQDDFTTSGLTDGLIGELKWGLLAGTVIVNTPVASHPGIRRLTTPASSALTAISVGSGTVNGMFLPTETFDGMFVWKLAQTDTDTMCRVGFGLAWNADPPDDGVWFEKAYADTTWFAVTRASGTQTRTAMNAVVAGTWYRGRIRRQNDGAIGFSIGDITNMADTVRHTTNVPTVSILPVIQIRSQSGVAKGVDADYFSLHITGMGR